MGAELGANTFVLWGERDGTESHAAQPVVEALDRHV
jgi:xylose isomerase